MEMKRETHIGCHTNYVSAHHLFGHTHYFHDNKHTVYTADTYMSLSHSVDGFLSSAGAPAGKDHLGTSSGQSEGCVVA